jgi:Protein of unknown function (DUF1203)
MPFQIHALDPSPFTPLFALDEAALWARGAKRVVATSNPGFPCRVSLVDAEVGDTLLLLNHEHLAGLTPYAATHAIYVREGAVRAAPAPGEVPDVLARRLLAVRAYDNDSMMIDADVTEGDVVGDVIDRFFAQPETRFIHLHNAKRGCFAATVTRA